MKTGRKFFCRLFQKVMYACIPLFPYRTPKLLNGVSEIAQVLQAQGVQRVLLVTSQGVHARGQTAPLLESLRDGGLTCTVYDKTIPDPTTDNVEQAGVLYKENNCQAIIAFGGGSVMDCAKAVGARIARPKLPLQKMQGLIKICKKIPLLIAVPTTAGTGSETTVAAVIVDSATHHKYVISDFCLIPRYAVLDAETTKCMSPYLTATTGMDALTHAIEAYVGKSVTKDTALAAEQAVKLIVENLEQAYQHGDDLQARNNMLHASYLAGMAFTKSYVGYVHAVAHTLGGKYGIAHGLANAVLLPKVLRAYGEHVTHPLAKLAKAAGLVDVESDEKQAAEALISYIEGLNERMQIPKTLTCVCEADISELSKRADKEANPLYPVPVLWDETELQAVYKSLMQ